MPDLDELLDAWAHAHRLPDVRAEAIRRTIFAEDRTQVSDPAWWRSFTAQVNATVIRAMKTAPVSVGSAGHQPWLSVYQPSVGT